MSLLHFAGTVTLLNIFQNTADERYGKGEMWLPIPIALYVHLL